MHLFQNSQDSNACKARDWRGSARASLHQRRRNHRSRYARRFLREPREGIIAVYLITQQKKVCHNWRTLFYVFNSNGQTVSAKPFAQGLAVLKKQEKAKQARRTSIKDKTARR